ncbi:MAG: chemotaxis protein CheW [Blastopirellula sp.]|nr:MAG: chemotaxis protein CheW [Blastopirellula sp.]
MSNESTKKSTNSLQLATFYLNDLLLGIRIENVQEINRQLDCTIVPHAPDYVQGVVNLRGDVVTVLNPKVILELDNTDIHKGSRNLIINSEGELIGLCVDRVSDILTIPKDQINEPPANLKGIDGRFFKGIHQLESEVLVLLNIDEIICSTTAEFA